MALSLQEATKKSTIAWRHDLEGLFNHAKDRFPDVVWEVGEGPDVWGHKAIVYARAPPTFQARYFLFRPSSSPPPATSSGVSLELESSRTPSPVGPLLRLTTSMNAALFSNELEYLYTGQGFGEAFEFLYESGESTASEELRMDKLRKDLVFMWRSRLYSDVRISLTTAIFSSHRFILVSRSPYFHTALLSWPSPADQTLTLPSPPFTPASLHFTLGFIYTGTLIFSHRTYDLDTAFAILRSATYLSLPTLHDEIQARIVQEMAHGLFHAFLPFPEYDRLTAGAWGSAGCRCRQCARRAPRILDFSLSPDVKNSLLERGARRALVGLFGEGWCTSEFAALPPKLRDGILKGLAKRTTPQNAFALTSAAEHALARLGGIIDAWASDVRDLILTARKTIDECICTHPDACFATTDWDDIMSRDGVAFQDAERVEWIMGALLRGVSDRTAPPLYQTLVSSVLLRPHPSSPDAPMLSSTSHVRISVEQTRLELLKWINKRWLGIRQEGAFDALEPWALKEISDHMDVPPEDLLTPPSKPPRRTKEDATRISIHTRTLPMRNSSAASSMTGMSYKTLSASRTSLAASVKDTRPDSKLTPPAIVEPETQNDDQDPPLSLSLDHNPRPISVASVSTIRKTPKGTPTRTPTTPTPNASRPTSRISHVSTTSTFLSVSPAPRSRRTSASTSPAPGARERSRTASTASTATSHRNRTSTSPAPGRTSTSPAHRNRTTSTASTATSHSNRTAASPAPGRTSTSTASTATSHRNRTSTSNRTTSTASTATSHRDRTSTSPGVNRTTSTASTATSHRNRTSTSPAPSRTASTASTATSHRNRTTSTTSTSTAPRTRTISTGSVRSTLSSANGAKRPPVPSVKRTSVSTVSTAASRAGRAGIVGAVRRAGAGAGGRGVKDKEEEEVREGGKEVEVEGERELGHKKSESTSTLTMKRRGSGDTIRRLGSVDTTTNLPPPTLTQSKALKETLPLPAPPSPTPSPRGSTLSIGIPCIISLKRKRFKAYARYIGEVAGEDGPWVGVEVEVGPGAAGGDVGGEREREREWNDGTWGGVRYFDMGSGSEWEYGADERERRRRVEGWGYGKGSLLKREGDQLSIASMSTSKRVRSASPVMSMSDGMGMESRGLFVRPQQVLYVVDALGDDL